MASRLPAAPLAWGLGATTGASLALVLGAYVPSWGVAIALPVALVTFSIAMRFANTGEVRGALAFALAFTFAFVVVTAPVTWVGLRELADLRPPPGVADPLTEAQLGALRGELVRKWLVAITGVPIGVWALRRYGRPRT